MEKIVEEIEIDWYRTPLNREVLQALNERSDWKGAVQSVGYLGFLLLTGVFAYWAGSEGLWLCFAIGLFVHGIVATFAINAVHELVHGTVFKTKYLNDFFASLFAFYGCINHKLFWGSHAEHHKFTLHNPQDQEVVLPVGYSVKEFFMRGFVDIPGLIFKIKYHVRLAFGNTEGSWEKQILPDSAKEKRQEVFRWSRIILIGYLAIFVLSIILSDWWIPSVLLASLTLGRFLHNLCNNLQHIGLVDYVPDFRMCCRTIYLNPFVSFLYWRMNYHIEHHMYAGVPCYNLPKMHKAILHDLPHCHKGLISSWREVARTLIHQRNNPDYQYEQKLRAGATPYYRERAKAVDFDSANQDQAAQGHLLKWECQICGFIYDEAKGLPEDGISAGTRWEDIPEDWSCPDCGVAKADFDMIVIGAAPVSDSRTGVESITSTTDEKLVILGAGLAGYTLAKDLRKKGYQGSITIVTSDRGEWYYKPDLSVAIQKGLSSDQLVKKTAGEMRESLNASIMTRTACRGIDTTKNQLILTEGSLQYDKLVIATGAEPLHIPMETNCAERIVQVNNLDQYRRYREKLLPESRVMILGAGLVGCEFANDLVRGGHSVSVVDIAANPMLRFLPEAYAETYQCELAKSGINWHMNARIDSVKLGNDNAISCLLDNGKDLEVDLVVSAVGLKPRTKIVEAAGLRCNRGVIVDEYLQTSAPGVYAIGDCAEFNNEIRPFISWLRNGADALSSTLVGRLSKVSESMERIIVKTPDCPLEILPAPTAADGVWLENHSEDGIDAFFLNKESRTIQGEIKISYLRSKAKMAV